MPPFLGTLFSRRRREERRMFNRYSCVIPAALAAADHQMDGSILDISRGGCLFRADSIQTPIATANVNISALGRSVSGGIASITRRGFGCRFAVPFSPPGFEEFMVDCFAAVHEGENPGGTLARLVHSTRIALIGRPTLIGWLPTLAYLESN
jgi:hypothetical protein